jgi:hypothetical protein
MADVGFVKSHKACFGNVSL